MVRELTPSEQVAELQDEFMLESAEYKLADPVAREQILTHINAILDAYLDMCPEPSHETSSN